MNKKILTTLLVAVFLVGTLTAFASAAYLEFYEDPDFNTPATTLEFNTKYFVLVKHEATDNTNLGDQYYEDVVTVKTLGGSSDQIDIFEADPEVGDTNNGDFSFAFELVNNNSFDVDPDEPGSPHESTPYYEINSFPGAQIEFCYGGTMGSSGYPETPSLPHEDLTSEVCTDYTFDPKVEFTGENTGSALTEIGGLPYDLSDQQTLSDTLQDVYDPTGNAVLNVLVQDYTETGSGSLTDALKIAGKNYDLEETSTDGQFTLDGNMDDGELSVNFSNAGGDLEYDFGDTFDAEYKSVVDTAEMGLPIRAYEDTDDDDVGAEDEFKHSYLFFQAIEDAIVSGSFLDTTDGFAFDLYEVTDDYDATLGGSEDFAIQVDEPDTRIQPEGMDQPVIDASGSQVAFDIEKDNVEIVGLEITGDGSTAKGIAIDIKWGANEGIKLLDNVIHGMAGDVGGSGYSWGIHSYNTDTESDPGYLEGIEIAGNEIYDIGEPGSTQGFGIGLQELASWSDADDDFAANVVANEFHDIKNLDDDNPGVGVIIQPAVYNGGSAVSNAANAEISCNFFDDVYADVAVGGDVEYTELRFNDFGNSEVGVAVDNVSSTPVDAEKNWWGTTAGPEVGNNAGGTGSKILGDLGYVDYRPWLNGVPLAGIGVDCTKNWDPTYQGNKTVHNVDDDEWFWTISGALDASNYGAQDGDTIEVYDGTYTDDLEAYDIENNYYDGLTIQAASDPIIELVNDDPLEVNNADDVTIKEFTIETDPDYVIYDEPLVKVEDSENFHLIDTTIDNHADQSSEEQGKGVGFYLLANDEEAASAELSGVVVQRNRIGVMVQNGVTGDADLTMNDGSSWSEIKSNGMLGLALGEAPLIFVEGVSEEPAAGITYSPVSGAKITYTKFFNNGSNWLDGDTIPLRTGNAGGALIASSGDNAVHESIFKGNAEHLQHFANINWDVTFLNTDDTADLDATDNYWNNADGPYHDTENPNSDGQAVRDYVTFDPYLSSEPSITHDPPTASFTADPKSGDSPLTVNFDASGSNDPDGSIVEYKWDFQDDGTWDETTTSPTTSYEYGSDGTYSVALQVTDDDDASDTVTEENLITVGDGGDTWEAGISVSSPNYSGSGTFGVVDGADDCKGSKDIMAPPAGPDYTRIYFTLPSSCTSQDDLKADLRAPVDFTSNTKTWNAVVNTTEDSGTTIDLSWSSNDFMLPSGASVTLKDSESGTTVNMLTNQTYSYTTQSAGASRNFEITVSGGATCQMVTTTIADGWNMFSVPGEATSTCGSTDPSVVFDELGPNFNMFRWDPTSGGYLTYPTDSMPIEPQYGQWYNDGAGTTIDAEVQTINSDFTITFENPGWHQIGHPFNYTTSLENAEVTYQGTTTSIDNQNHVTSYVYVWDPGAGSYEQIDANPTNNVPGTLEPWNAYWILVNDAPVDLTLSSTQAAAASSEAGTDTMTAAEADKQGMSSPPPPPASFSTEGPLKVAAYNRSSSIDSSVLFAAKGEGSTAVQGIKVEVQGLNGKEVFSAESDSRTLSWDTEAVPNGVYVYVASVKGNGSFDRTNVSKLLILK